MGMALVFKTASLVLVLKVMSVGVLLGKTYLFEEREKLKDLSLQRVRNSMTYLYEE